MFAIINGHNCHNAFENHFLIVFPRLSQYLRQLLSSKSRGLMTVYLRHFFIIQKFYQVFTEGSYFITYHETSTNCIEFWKQKNESKEIKPHSQIYSADYCRRLKFTCLIYFVYHSSFGNEKVVIKIYQPMPNHIIIQLLNFLKM